MFRAKAGGRRGGATAATGLAAGPAGRTTAAAAAVVLGRKMSRTGGAISPLPKTRRSLRTRGFEGFAGLGRDEGQGRAEDQERRRRLRRL